MNNQYSAQQLDNATNRMDQTALIKDVYENLPTDLQMQMALALRQAGSIGAQLIVAQQFLNSTREE